MSEIKLCYYTLICDRKNKNKFIEVLSNFGGVGFEVIYGKGSAKAGVFAKAFGFEVEDKKAVITCLLSSEKAKEVTNRLVEEYNFNRANTGLAFGINVESVAY